MTLHEEQARVQKAVTSALSGLREDPFLAGRVLAAMKGEKTMKKRLSVSLVIAIVLAVLSVSAALAAGLGLFGELSGTYSGDSRLPVLDQVAEPVGLEWTTEDGVTVRIEQAYYEDSRVFISYRISGNWNTTVLHEGKPDMVNFDDVEEDFIIAENLMSVIPERNEAFRRMDGREPLWLECSDANLHDGLFLADGTYLDIIGGDGFVRDDGSWVGWKECEIPEDLIADTLDFKAVLFRVTSVYVQDGTTYACSSQRGEQTDLPITLTRNNVFIRLTGAAAGETWKAEAALKMGKIDLRGSVLVACPPSWGEFWSTWDETLADDGMIMDWQLYRSGELADENAVEGIWYDEEAGLLVFDLLSARTDSTDSLALVPVLADETVDLDHAISLVVEP